MPAALTNPESIRNVSDAIRNGNRRILFNGRAGDSNMIRNGGGSRYGWLWHIGEALALRGVPCFGTPILGPGANDGSSFDPCGYLSGISSRAQNTASMVASYPSLSTYVPVSADLDVATGSYWTGSGTGNAWGLAIDALHPIGVANDLTAHILYYTFGSGSGGFSWSVRHDSASPNFFTDVATAIAITNNAAAGVTRSDMTIAAAARTQPLRLMPFKNGVAVTAPAAVAWCYMIRPASSLSHGWSTSCWFAKGGLGMYEMVDAIKNENANYRRAYAAAMLHQAGPDGIVVEFWQSGANDINDGALDSWTDAGAGVTVSHKCNTGDGYTDNFRVGRYLLNQDWVAVGGNPANYKHIIMPCHRLRLDPERSEVTDFRDKMKAFALTTTDTCVADCTSTDFGTANEWLTAFWETPGDGTSSGGDPGRSHLLQAGYSKVMQRMFNLIAGDGGYRARNFRSRSFAR